MAILCGGIVDAPVVRAKALITGAMSSEGRLRTHWRVRSKLCVVVDEASRPSIQRWPSHQTDDIGAMFVDSPVEGCSVEVERGGLVLVMSTTGVPQ